MNHNYGRDLFTIGQICEALDITRGALDSRVRSGSFPPPDCWRGPRIRLWSRHTLQALVDKEKALWQRAPANPAPWPSHALSRASRSHFFGGNTNGTYRR